MQGEIVIVGGGQAAAQAVEILRRKGFPGKITLIAGEPFWPYQRPPLSKKYLAGSMERDRLLLRPAAFYAEHGIDVRLGRRAETIDRSRQRILRDDGTAGPHDSLLLATGSVPRPLKVPGAELKGVHFLRTIEDVDRIRTDLAGARRLVIVGGGYIGLEVAATGRELGLEVVVLEMTDRVMSRVTCPQVSAFFEAEHARHGIKIICNSRVQALQGDPVSGRVRAVVCEDGSEHPADLVIVGVGVEPADALARAAGLECANGIVVDEYCRTSDPNILAAGDCTNHLNRRYGLRLRLESVDNAFEQATTAALTLLGTPTPHDKIPWFWSDQFDLKLIIVGICRDHDRTVVRGSIAARSFSICYLRGEELIAIDTVNNSKDQMAARKLIAARARPDLAKLADASIALKDCV
jgi:3-phenylpropionate/trans-cinnamate dioxygenase ferredoxin reductase subunit